MSRDANENSRKPKFERRLYRIVPVKLVDTRSQQQPEADVVEGLAHRGSELAWIGTVDEVDLHPRAVGGEQEFLATLESAFEEPRHAAETFIRAARTGELQCVADIETLLSAEWRDAALDAGYRSAFAVPLSYHGRVLRGAGSVGPGTGPLRRAGAPAARAVCPRAGLCQSQPWPGEHARD